MTDSPAVASHQGARPATGRERRRHHHLRDLIDEMLASVRAAANRDLFSPEERMDAEQQLSAIMTRVRAETMKVAGDEKPAA